MLKYSFMTMILLFALFANGHAAPYVDHSNGVVTDQATQLMWQQEDDGEPSDWYAALDYCNDLVWPAGGYSDWRLPDMKELVSIVDYTAYDPAINAVFTSAKSSWYWSSTASLRLAWFVDFKTGLSSDFHKDYDHHGFPSRHFYVRCVR